MTAVSVRQRLVEFLESECHSLQANVRGWGASDTLPLALPDADVGEGNPLMIRDQEVLTIAEAAVFRAAHEQTVPRLAAGGAR